MSTPVFARAACAALGGTLVLGAFSLAGQRTGARCGATATSMTPPGWSSAARDPSRAPTDSGPSRGRPLTIAKLTDVPLPGPARRFDYQSLDSSTGRLYIAHMYGNRLDVFGTRTGRLIASIQGFPGATGVLAVPEQHRVYVSVTGRHDVTVVDDRTLTVIASVSGAQFPDGIAYAPDEQKVFVSDEHGGTDLVIDARTNAKLGVVALGGEAGNTHYDGRSHCVLVAVQTTNDMVAIDPETHRVLQRYPMPCQHPHGFLIDEPNRLAFVTCEGDAKLLVVDLRTMRTVATHRLPAGPDVLAFDPDWQLLYVACESGSVAVFEERDGALASAAEYRAPHAHTVSVDPRTHRVYLPLQDVEGHPVLRILAVSR